MTWRTRLAAACSFAIQGVPRDEVGPAPDRVPAAVPGRLVASIRIATM